MPQAPSQTQMLASILATTRIIEAEALMRFNTTPTVETTNTILEAFVGASRSMQPAGFVPNPCGGVHIMSMCWPRPLAEGWLRPLINDIREGRIVMPDGSVPHW